MDRSIGWFVPVLQPLPVHTGDREAPAEKVALLGSQSSGCPNRNISSNMQPTGSTFSHSAGEFRSVPGSESTVTCAKLTDMDAVPDLWQVCGYVIS